MLKGAIDQAGDLLPFRTKCLAKAAAMQWLLRLCAIPSRLVIAFHTRERTAEHAFHAWVEHNGKIVMGACDVEEYRPALVLSQGPGNRATRD